MSDVKQCYVCRHKILLTIIIILSSENLKSPRSVIDNVFYILHACLSSLSERKLQYAEGEKMLRTITYSEQIETLIST